MGKLTEEEIVAIRKMVEKGYSNTEVAEKFGVTEGTVRYHRDRRNVSDGRIKPSLIERLGLSEKVSHWVSENVLHEDVTRPAPLKQLYEILVYDYGYTGSYKSVKKYVRSHFPAPKRRPFRRIETPPGGQSQTDWATERIIFETLSGRTTVYAFVMKLSHSRKTAVVWSWSMDQLNWHRAHNEAFKRLGGIAAVNRIDNLKTGMASGAGPWGSVNESYRVYARQMRFHVDPTLPRQPRHKGKVERKIVDLRNLGMNRMVFRDLEHLQAWTDERLLVQSKRLICPVTGRTVHETWLDELEFLAPLPAAMPEPFDLVRTCKVHRDCVINFSGKTFCVPFPYAMKSVEARRCADRIQILDPENNALIREYSSDPSIPFEFDNTCYEGEDSDEALSPMPLGRLAKRLLEIGEIPVEKRPVDLYAALAEVAR